MNAIINQFDNTFIYGHKDKNEKELDMRKNRKNNSHTYRKRICIMAVLLAGSLMLGGCGVKKENAADNELPEIVIGMDYFEPYSYQVSNGEYKGIDVELAKEAFQRLGYQPKFENIVWEDKDELLAEGTIDCLWSCYSMNGREDKYQWAGPYMISRQVVAVNPNSDIYKLSDLEGKKLAVQSTTKPEEIFLRRTDERIPKLGNLISLENRELIYTFLGKGYVDAVGAHEESIIQYMKDYNMELRILDEPLMTVGLGVAFAKDDTRGICQKLEQTLADMKEDGTAAKIIGKYLDDPEKYLEVDKIGEE